MHKLQIFLSFILYVCITPYAFISTIPTKKNPVIVQKKQNSVRPNILAPKPSANIQAPDRSTHFYQIGQEQGKKIVDILNSETKTPDKDILTCQQNEIKSEIDESFNKLNSCAPETEEHQKNFSYVKQYMKGYKNSLEAYKEIESDDFYVLRRNFFAKQQMQFCDTFITAVTYDKFKADIVHLLGIMQEETAFFSSLDQVVRIPDLSDIKDHPAFLAGYELGKQLNKCLRDRAQGLVIDDGINTALKKQMSDFFQNLEGEEPQEKNRQGINYLLGMEVAIKELSIDQLTKELSEEKAKALKSDYDVALKTVQMGQKLISAYGTSSNTASTSEEGESC